ncbi:MAG TPA: hypothetical protein VEV17_00840 [Bryobacteraceae bacterium]|nr:hypothetical protein [Bryobacteraceae bacterium]
MAAPSTAGAKVNRWSSDRRLYTGVAIGTALIIFIGFAQTYYLKFLFGTPPLRLLLHVHGMVMTAWIALFFVQVRLIAAGRRDLHRRLGVAGAVLAGLAIVLGAAVAVSQGHIHLINNDPAVDPPLVFLPVPVGVLILFGTFVAAAILLRRRADYHKRLMALACLSILLPGIDRLPFQFIQTVDQSVLFGLNDLCVVICIAYDTFKTRRLHPVWVWGGGLIAGVQILTLMVRHTAAWLRIAAWMLK